MQLDLAGLQLRLHYNASQSPGHIALQLDPESYHRQPQSSALTFHSSVCCLIACSHFSQIIAAKTAESAAGLLVMHSHVSDPLPAFSELSKSAALPPLMRQGVMDPNVLKHYLLLHDDAAAAAHGGWAK